MRWVRCYWTQVNNMQVLVQDNHNVKTQSSSYSFVPEVRLTRAHESKFSFPFLSEDYTLPRGLNTAMKDATTFCQIKAMVLWHAPKQRNLGLNWDMKRCQPGAKHQSDPYFDTQSYKQRRGDHRERARTWNSAPQAGSPFTFFSLSSVKTGVERQKSHSMSGESVSCCNDGEFWSDRPRAFDRFAPSFLGAVW